jgi:PhnB protein
MTSVNPLLSIRDVEASLKFYTELLGFSFEGTMLPGDDGKPVFAGVKRGETTIWLDHTEYADLPPDTPVGVGVELYISLEKNADIDALYEKVKAEGVKIVVELQEQFWGDKRFVIQDLDGYRLSFSKPVREVSHEEMAAHSQAHYSAE